MGNKASSYMNAREALLSVRGVVESYGDEKSRYSYYAEFHRRLLVLQLVERYCRRGGVVLDLGAQPFIVSGALKLMGYKVIAYDYDPRPYLRIAEAFGVEVRKCDLEREGLGVPEGSADCAILSEVIEHLNPYYVGFALTEVNRALRNGGVLVVTTPNIASLFRRVRLLLGRQPQYACYVHEYTEG